MKKLSLLFVVLICVMSVSARTLYLRPTGTSYGGWAEGNERYAIYCYDDAGNDWVSMTPVEGDTAVYKADIDDKWSKVIFCRMNGSTTDNKWENKWNQSGDLVLAEAGEGNNLWTNSLKNDGKGKYEGSWSVYVPGQTPDPNPGEGDTESTYGMLIGKRVVKATYVGEKDGYSEHLVKAHVNAGDSCKLINTYDNATWMPKLDGYSVQTFTLSEDNSCVVCTQSGCYDFYIKLKYEEDTLYIGEGTDCSDEGQISALEQTSVEKSNAVKIIENGQIYILRDGIRYNALGAQVQ